MANLTIDAGNFAPPTRTRPDSLKVGMIVDFYERLNYDAVTLASKETAFGLEIWKNAAKNGLPVLAANLFADKKGKTPLFKLKQANGRKDNGQFVIKKDHGEKLGIIGFLSDIAWKARKDTATPPTFRSPFEMGELVRKVAKKSDLLTLVGDFNLAEAESLASVYPQADMIIGSNIRIDQIVRHGKTVLVGLPPRGNTGNYIEWHLSAPDSERYVNRVVPLESAAMEDSTIARLLTKVKEDISGPPPVPGKQPGAHAQSVAPATQPPKPAPAPPGAATATATPPPPAPPKPSEPDGSNQ